MIDQADNTHNPVPADQPLALRLSEGLGPLVEREFVRAKTMAYGPNRADDETREGDFGTWGDWRALVLRVAEAAEAAESERWAMLLAGASGIAESNVKRADDCGMLSRALLDALKVLRA